jgi:hypothetical protein
LLAGSALASVALQISVSQTQHAAFWLEQAARIGQSAAEALRGGFTNDQTEQLLQTNLSALPDGNLTITNQSSHVLRLTISWSEPANRYGISTKDTTAQASCPGNTANQTARIPRCFVLQVAT